MAFYFGDGIEVRADGLQRYPDHLSVSLALRSHSKWLAGLLASSAAEQQQVLEEILCRRCRQGLLVAAPSRQILLLPTAMWQACADVLACEECAPIGGGHIAAKEGRVYVSPQCLVVSAADLRADAVHSGADGLVRCSCHHVLGESQAPSSQQRPQPTGSRTPGGRTPQKRLFCQDGWGTAVACRGRGVALYKHRVSMPVPRQCDKLASSEEDLIDDALGSFTEASAVGAELLNLRGSGGPFRLLLLPSPPEELKQASDIPVGCAVPTQQAEAVELRILVHELIMLGPTRHASEADSSAHEPANGLQEAAAVCGAQRCAKVCFRRRLCTAAGQAECRVVVVPSMAFVAVCEALDWWSAALPPSHVEAPLSAKDGFGSWKTSLLPLPPREGGVE